MNQFGKSNDGFWSFNFVQIKATVITVCGDPSTNDEWWLSLPWQRKRFFSGFCLNQPKKAKVPTNMN